MNQQDMYVKNAIDSWQAQINAINKDLEKISDEQLMQEIAPSRNRGIYLLGHLTAVHDAMLPLLRFEEALYPELRATFIEAPDKKVAEIPSAKQLREQWKTVNEKLANHFKGLSTEEWLARHNSISEEDFVKEPHRNRMSVLLSRSGHLGYHRGQLVLLVKKS
jgi:uncharacterized damage-inducible protein DinB